MGNGHPAGKTGAMSTELDLGWFDPSLGAVQRREASGVGTGLSRAVAERLAVDVVLVRVVFVVLAMCSGLGVGLYAWGTALTRGPQGSRPIDRWLPGFHDWSALAQKTLVIASTIALMFTIGAAFPLPWGAGVLMLIVLALWSRRSRSAAAPGQPPSAAGRYPTSALPTTLSPAHPVDDQALVEHWRRSITEAVGTHRAAVPVPQLPEVDLYADAQEEPLLPPAPRPRSSWLGGLAVLAVMIAAATIAGILLGASATVTLAVGTAVGGLGAVLFALVARSRRLPRLVLALVALPMVAIGWLAAQAPLPVVGPDTRVVQVTAEDAVVDLGEFDLRGYDTVRIEAVASNVDVILPGPVLQVETVENLASDVTDLTEPVHPSITPLQLKVEISAQASNVTIKDAP